MLEDKLSMVIYSCDEFSDLWDAHMFLLKKNWENRKIDTFLVTDKKTNRDYFGVKILAAGEKSLFTQRVELSLKYIKTKYVLVTLDDYFPIYKILDAKLENLIREMEEYNLDYVRLFKRPDSKISLGKGSELYKVDLFGNRDSNYQVNLYVGIWKKEFLAKTLRMPLDPWEYELSLSKIARELGAKCALSKGKEFEVLDVVRKGKILHRAHNYLTKHGLYDGTREIAKWKTELRINFFTFIKDHTNQVVIDFGKKILRKFGVKFYSDSEKL